MDQFRPNSPSKLETHVSLTTKNQKTTKKTKTKHTGENLAYIWAQVIWESAQICI